MKLLIVTQKIDKDDGVLSFMLGWIKEFAQECEQVTVIALYVAEHDLPSSVRVLSLGKEKGVSRLKYITKFFQYIFSERNNYDAVFVHMNQVYVNLGGIFWRLMGKRVALWYAHGAVPFGLRIAEKLTHVIIASTPSGFRLKTKKLRIVGQGINTELFTPIKRTQKEGQPIRLLIIGRISPTKDYVTLIHAFKELIKRGHHVTLDVVGGAGTPEQEGYFTSIKKLVTDFNMEKQVTFHGSKPHKETVAFFDNAHIFVSTATNGSFDKAMGDAMSTALPLIACNDAMNEVLGDLRGRLMFPKGDTHVLVEKIESLILLSNEERNKLGHELRLIIEKDHSLKNLIKKIIFELK